MHVNYCQSAAIIIFFSLQSPVAHSTVCRTRGSGASGLFLRRHGTIWSLDHIWKFYPEKVDTASVSCSNSSGNLHHLKHMVLWISWRAACCSARDFPPPPPTGHPAHGHAFPPVALGWLWWSPDLSVSCHGPRWQQKEKQWQLWLASCSVSTLNWLLEKSEECQSWHKGERETWVVRREAGEGGRQGQQWAGRRWPFWKCLPVSSPVWQREQAMLSYRFLYTDALEQS